MTLMSFGFSFPYLYRTKNNISSFSDEPGERRNDLTLCHQQLLSSSDPRTRSQTLEGPAACGLC